MQVHKETIDKIPGALPTRDSVQMEIYGMQGIPPGATRGAADEEPDAKRARGDDMPPMPPGPMPGMMPPFHGYPHMMPPMMPPGMPPFMPPMGMGMPPHMPPFPPRGPMPPRHFPPAPGNEFYGGGPPVHRPGPPRGGYGGGDFNDYGNGGAPPHGARPPYGEQSGRDDYHERNEDSSRYDRDNGSSSFVGRPTPSEYAEEKSFPPERKEEYDSPASAFAGGFGDSASARAPVTAAPPAAKLGARTKIIHHDDYNVSLEERRASMMGRASP